MRWLTARSAVCPVITTAVWIKARPSDPACLAAGVEICQRIYVSTFRLSSITLLTFHTSSLGCSFLLWRISLDTVLQLPSLSIHIGKPFAVWINAMWCTPMIHIWPEYHTLNIGRGAFIGTAGDPFYFTVLASRLAPVSVVVQGGGGGVNLTIGLKL